LGVELVGQTPLPSLDLAPGWELEPEEVEDPTRHPHGVNVEVLVKDPVGPDANGHEPMLPCRIVLFDQSMDPLDRMPIEVGFAFWALAGLGRLLPHVGLLGSGPGDGLGEDILAS